MLTNAQFQTIRRAATFSAAHDGTFSVARWITISDGHGIVTPSIETAPCGLTLTTEVSGKKAGKLSILDSGMTKRLCGRPVSLQVKLAGTGNAYIALIGWTGTEDKPNVHPVSAWNGNGVNPSMASGWTMIASSSAISLGAEAVYTLEDIAVPSSMKNLAVMIWRDGQSVSDTLFLADAQLDYGASALPFCPPPSYQEALACDYFYQHYTAAHLKNTEMGFGRIYPGTYPYAYFQFPLRSRLRGRLGGDGADDVTVTWEEHGPGKWWVYADGSYCDISSPELICHHDNFLFFKASVSGLTAHYPCVWRSANTDDTITLDAEIIW